MTLQRRFLMFVLLIHKLLTSIDNKRRLMSSWNNLKYKTLFQLTHLRPSLPWHGYLLKTTHFLLISNFTVKKLFSLAFNCIYHFEDENFFFNFIYYTTYISYFYSVYIFGLMCLCSEKMFFSFSTYVTVHIAFVKYISKSLYLLV